MLVIYLAVHALFLSFFNFSCMDTLWWQDQGTMLTSTEIDLTPCKGSALRLYLPDGLILRLMSEV